jgi:hypothetical protein
MARAAQTLTSVLPIGCVQRATLLSDQSARAVYLINK